MDKFDTNAGGDAVDVDAGDAAGFSLLAFLKAIKSEDMSSRPASRHFSLHKRLSSARIRQYRQV